ncbi:hypothetical protein CMT75_18595 [Elizabethkingia anophelis]|uniref:hypothetical protein n=1 Tax=Elizabethkingia sp. M8 TaxID=2796140 RepID=UPI0019078727|nr:hypothetical protein [Elizabethkingia sp. M8]MDV3950527.1 hypothetical protein [Elizabethkingia anophelis]QQM26596.1 hypothetical protein JCR23_17420 [Elizabethkingia sp. M8]
MKKLILIFALLYCFYNIKSQYYIIGDSQSFQLAKQSKLATILSAYTKSGIGIRELNTFLENSNVENQIKNNARAIFISIGVNDNYNDFGISRLIKNLDVVFPNAFFFIIKGSYGWGNVKNVNFKNYNSFYTKFKNAGTYVLYDDIGNGDPHHQKSEYFILGKKIDEAVLKTENYLKKKK